MLEDDESPDLPHLGSGRHFSWSILDDLDVEEDNRRATSGVQVFGARGRLLTPEEEIELGRRVRAGTDEATEDHDEDARAAVEQLVLANLRLCIRPARARLQRGQFFDDIVQDGFLGLIRAAQKFDPEHGTRFSTYAMFWIRQAMDRGADRNARTIRLPSHVITLQRRIEVAEKKALIDDRTTDDAVARIVRSGPEQVRAARDAIHEFVDMDEAESELRSHQGRDPRSFEPDPDDPEPPGFEEVLTTDEQLEPTDALGTLLARVIDGLSSREREVLVLYYGLDDFPHETLESIGEQFGLTRERARQIRNNAIDNIRRLVAVERARGTDFDAEMNLDADAVRAITSEDIMLHVSHVLSGRDPESVPRFATSQPEVSSAERRRLVQTVLSDLRATTSTWRSELLFEFDPEFRRHPGIVEHIEPLIHQEPYDRRALVETLAELVADLGPDTIGENLLDIAGSAVRAALKDPPPDADALGRVLRLVRFVGCSTDPVAFRLALHAPQRATVALPSGSRVASTWHYDEQDREHVELRQELHRHGDALGLEWNSAFDDDLDLMIAESFQHRSAKTFAAVLRGIPICDIATFLDHRAGDHLTILRSPVPVPWTVICRGCHIVDSVPRSPGATCPTHCSNCSSSQLLAVVEI